MKNKGFNYVDIVSDGCAGWLNLFFGDDVVALVDNVELANRIRSEIKPRSMKKGAI